MPSSKTMNIAIIGAGPSGLAVGRELLQQGIDTFTIFEKEPAAGGTWQIHSYPGLACDVWAHSYTFSYLPNPNWSASFVPQKEIKEYLQDCVGKLRLLPHMRYNTRINRAVFDNKHWQLEFENDRPEQFDIVINAMGNQHTAAYPKLNGRDKFNGHSWHSTDWNHDVDLSGRKVIVVGSAAAAVQIVPELAKVVDQLFVLQRTANWVMPRRRKIYSDRQRKLFNKFPVLMKVLRAGQGLLMSGVEKGVELGHKRMDMFENMGKKYIKDVIKDQLLQEMLTPKTRFGCKRALVSDDFYQALNKENVTLVPAGAAEVVESGLITSDGQTLVADVIIYCTGYKLMDFERIEVLGASGKNLADTMAHSPEVFKGIAAPQFPNYFFAIGPNGLALSVSYFITAETNAQCIVRVIKQLQASGKSVVDVKQALCDEYNQWMMGQFSQFSWGAEGCSSYYSTAAGRHPFIYPGGFKRFKQERKEVSLQDFELS
jgi:cyclohexanone monooxygenase